MYGIMWYLVFEADRERAGSSPRYRSGRRLNWAAIPVGVAAVSTALLLFAAP